MYFWWQNEVNKITITIYFRKFFITLVPKQVRLAGHSLNLTFATQEMVDFLNKNQENW